MRATEDLLSRPLVVAALLIGIVKAAQYAVDSKLLFYFDSPAFLANALGRGFIPELFPTYGPPSLHGSHSPSTRFRCCTSGWYMTETVTLLAGAVTR